MTYPKWAKAGCWFGLLAFIPAAVFAQPVKFEVEGVVQPLKQQGDTCWATTATMLLSWKRNQSLSVSAVAAEAGSVFGTLYSKGKGLPRAKKADFLQALGLQNIPPMCYEPRAFLELLQKKGALWITVDSSSAAFTHAVIVTGLSGDGTAAGTKVAYVDPASGTAKTLPFGAFQKKFESAAGKSDIQIVSAN